MQFSATPAPDCILQSLPQVWNQCGCGLRVCVTHLAGLMDSLYAAVAHSEHRALWKPIDLNQRVGESSSPHCSKLPLSLGSAQLVWGRTAKTVHWGRGMSRNMLASGKKDKKKIQGISENTVFLCWLDVSWCTLLVHFIAWKGRCALLATWLIITDRM